MHAVQPLQRPVEPPARGLLLDLRETVALAVPAALTQLSNVSMGVVDTAMVGPLGAVPLAGVAFANSLYFGPSIFLFGLVAAVHPIAAQRHGAGQPERVRQILHDGLAAAVLLGLLGTAAMLLLSWHLNLFTSEEAVTAQASVYLRCRVFALLPNLLFIGYRGFLDAQGLPMPSLWASVIANLVNAFFNWALIYGHLGFPALGVAGSGIATSISTLFQAAYLAVSVRRGFPWASRGRPSRAGLRKMFRIGLPMGMHQGLEVGIFALAAILVLQFGAVPMAAHQIAIQVASCSFMVAVGCSVAAATRVGQALGRGRPDEAARAGWISIAVGVAFMACSATVYLTFGRHIVGFFTADEKVVAFGTSLLKIAGAFQLSDGIQAVTSGALRGAGDTRFSLYCSLTGYWFVGLPLCLLLGFTLKLGPLGLWWGLTAALTATAAGLLWRFGSGGWKEIGRL
jgi:MATE family, multidrug efflux pump